MTILLIVTGLPDERAPYRSAFNLNFARELKKRGIEIEILYLRSMHYKRKLLRRREIEGISYIEASFIVPKIGMKKSSFFLKYILSSIKKLIKNPDVVHVVGGGGLPAAFILSSYFRSPLLSQFIGSDINFHLSSSLRNPDFVKGLDRSKLLVFNSEGLKKEFFKKNLLNYKSEVVYRGVDINEYAFYTKDYSKEIKTLFLGGFPTNRKNLKGGETLLGMIKKLSKLELSKKLSFKIAGPNTSQPLIGNNDNKNLSVEFIGALSKKEVKEALLNSHIVIIPSLLEGIPNVLYESMASGNTVIASDVGGIPEILNSEVNGIMVSPDNIEELYNAFLDLIEKPEKMDEMARMARADIEKIDYSNFIDKYLSMYNFIKNT